MITLGFSEAEKAKAFVGESVLATNGSTWEVRGELKEVRDGECPFVVGDTRYNCIALLANGELPVVWYKEAAGFVGWYGRFFDGNEVGINGVLEEVRADCKLQAAEGAAWRFFHPIKAEQKSVTFNVGDIVRGFNGTICAVTGYDPADARAPYLIGASWSNGKDWEKVND